jgi:hypothetical protein
MLISVEKRNRFVDIRDPSAGLAVASVLRRGAFLRDSPETLPERRNLASHDPQLRRWEYIYRTVDPYRGLHYLTPLEFLESCNNSRGKVSRCHPDWTSRFPDPEGRESATPFCFDLASVWFCFTPAGINSS